MPCFGATMGLYFLPPRTGEGPRQQSAARSGESCGRSPACSPRGRTLIGNAWLAPADEVFLKCAGGPADTCMERYL